MSDCSWPTARHQPGPLTGLVAGGVTVVVLATAFGLGALGLSWAWVVYPLGFGGLLPFALGAAARYENRGRSSRRAGRLPTAEPSAETTAEGTALQALGGRYARGEIDEAEFERRVERLLRTETVADAREYVGSDR